MVTPILSQKLAFDKSYATTFPFTSNGGNQVVKNRLQIANNVTGVVVYDSTQTTYTLYHTLAENTLTNGTYYNARLKTYDASNVESEWSNTIQFYCFANPTLVFQNLPSTVNNSTQLFEALYSQVNGEPIATYQFTLYDSLNNIVSQSAMMYNTNNTLPPMTLSYTFSGLLNAQTYQIECNGTTLNGMSVTTGKSTFLVQYIEPSVFSITTITSDCDSGVNTIASNLQVIEGRQTPSEPTYISSDTELDLRDFRELVTWDDGFAIENTFTLKWRGRQWSPSTTIFEATSSTNPTEKLVLKYMNNVLDPTPTAGEFDALNITAGTFDSKNFTPVKFEYKFYQTLGTQTYNEYVQLIYTDPLGVVTTMNSNQIAQTLDDDKTFIFVRFNGTSWTVSIENLKTYWQTDVYGLEVDMVNKTFTRLAGAVGKTAGANFDIAPFNRRRCILTDGGTPLAYYGESGYTETGALTQQIIKGGTTYPIGTKVQVMVEQHKFYYRVVPLLIEPISGGKGYHLRKARYYISATQKEGMKLHKAFNVNGVQKDYIYLSAYEGSLYDTSALAYILNDEQVADFNADKMCSIANAKPMSGLTQLLTRANARKLCNNRGAGWMSHNIYAISVTQWLILVEYASMDCQRKIGRGVCDYTDDGSTNMAVVTGATSGMGNNSGIPDGGVDGKCSVTYRGEENLWGNIWTWLDGINIIAKGVNEAYLHKAGATMADDTTTGYKNYGTQLSHQNGYQSAVGYSEDYPEVFLPTACDGTDALPIGDYYWQNYTYNGILIARLGGYWTDGSYCGAWFLNVNAASSHCGRNVGGRLVFIP